MKKDLKHESVYIRSGSNIKNINSISSFKDAVRKKKSDNPEKVINQADVFTEVFEFYKKKEEYIHLKEVKVPYFKKEIEFLKSKIENENIID